MSTDNIYSELLSSRPELISKIWPKWNDYIPHFPTTKGLAFLLLSNLEALFGGAAGGAKSDTLLTCGLQYADVPGYSGIIFRRTLADLNLSSALLHRCHQWLTGTNAKYDSVNHRYLFPTASERYPTSPPATLQFGYIGESSASARYQGAEFQFIGWDELAQHFDWDYTFMFSRLRSPIIPCLNCKTPVQKAVLDEDDDGQFTVGWEHINLVDCNEAIPDPISLRAYPPNKDGITVFDIPWRVRATSNPPRGIDPASGNGWLKDRFRIKEMPVSPTDALQKIPLAIKYLGNGIADDPAPIKSIYRGTHPDRPMIPAFAWDNPYINQEKYLSDSLGNLDPITRDQQAKGDWGISADGRFRKAWKKIYSWNGENIILGPNRRPYPHLDTPPIHGSYFAKNLRCFQTLDVAATSKEGPGDTDIWKNIPQAHTVLSTWLLTPRSDLIWLRIRRGRIEIPDVIKLVRDEYKALQDLSYNPELIGIDENGMGVGVVQILIRMGYPIRGIFTHVDKLSNAADAAQRMENGKIYFPQFSGATETGQNLDLDVLESELFTWIGSPRQQSDQIDTLSNAAKLVSVWAGVEGRIVNYEQPEMM